MKRIVVAITGFFFLVTPALGEEPAPPPLVEALTGGTPYIDARYRFEHVDQDGFAKDAKASTLRLRFGYVTGKAYDFSARVEVEHIDPIGNDNFNSTTNGKSTRPTVADPGETEINQLYLRYQGVPDTTLTVGRQRVILDNARFVGNVGFRQNEQTFDAVTVVNTSLPDTRLFYGYVWHVNRVFGDRSANGNFRVDTHLFNGSYSGLGFVKPSAYLYLLDFTDPARENSSTATYGLRLTGKTAIAEGWNALYTAEYAHQTDWADSAVDNSHDYYTAEVGLGRSSSPRSSTSPPSSATRSWTGMARGPSRCRSPPCSPSTAGPTGSWQRRRPTA